MYQPLPHRQEQIEAQHALIRSHPLGLLISHGAQGLEANSIPFLIDPQASKLGTLQAHMARANGQWRALDAASDVLVVFQGADHYITPGWYETKRETGKVVPTWNYVMVQARGRPRVIDDPAWLRAQIEALTKKNESARPAPWAVGDAPEAFIAMQIKAIVGLVEVTKTFRPDPTDATGKFGMVDIKAVSPMPKPVTLEAVKAEPRLAKMALVANSRLSVQPVTDEEWKIVCEMGGL